MERGACFVSLNSKLHCVSNEVKSVEFHQAWKNHAHAFLRRFYECAYFDRYFSDFLMFSNKRRLHIWICIWSFVSACAGIWKMWKDEVRRVERRVCFQECQGQSGVCAPCRPPFSLRYISVTVHPLRPAGEAPIFSFLPLQGAADASPSPQHSRFVVSEVFRGLSRTLPSWL